jgi:hypothetical protein
MSLPNANAIARQAKVRAELEAQDFSSTSSISSYLQDTPDDKVLSDPRALADIRDYYRKWKGRYFIDDKEMLEEFHEDQSWNNLNTIGAGINWAEASSANEEQRAHMARMSSLYHKVPMLNSKGGFADHIGGFHVAANIGQSVLADPINLVGFGAGAAVGKAAARGAVAVGESGMRAGVKAAAKRGAFVEGAVGAPVGVGIDALTQGYEREVGLSDEYSLGRGAMAAGIGLAAGAGLGGIMAAFSGAWGARIGTKQAQRLLDEGYTPETIPSMTQAEVDFALTPAGAAAKVDTETKSNYDQAEAEEAVEQKFYDDREAERAATAKTEATAKAQSETMWRDRDDESVITESIDRIKSALEAVGDPAARAPLVAHEKFLYELRARVASAAVRLDEIDTATRAGAKGKELEALLKERAKLITLQEHVVTIRHTLDGTQRAADEAMPATPEATAPVAEAVPTAPKADVDVADPISPTTVPEPTLAPAATKVDVATGEPTVAEVIADGQDLAPAASEIPEGSPAVADDLIEAVVPEAKPIGRRRADLTDESIALLQELGVKQKTIDNAVKSKRPDQRKNLMKKIVESKGLKKEEGEDLSLVSINDLAARIKTYTDEQAASATPVAPTATPTSTLDEAAATINELTAPKETPVEPTQGPDYTTAAMESDIPTMDDAKIFDDIIKIIEASSPSRTPEATAPVATATAAKTNPDGSLYDPIFDGEAASTSPAPKVSDPEPIPFEQLTVTTLDDLGLTPEDSSMLRGALKGIFPKKNLDATVFENLTIQSFETLALDVTRKKWAKNSTDFQKRIEATKVIENLRAKLMPNGVQKNTQSRKESILQIRKIFADKGDVFVENAVALFDRFGELGHADVAPKFKSTVRSNAWEGDPTQNNIRIGRESGYATPKLATFYHEVAHWMYGNVLTPTQRIEFMDSMGKYYKEDGSLDTTKLADALPFGSESRVDTGRSRIDGVGIRHNSDESPQELFAESFSMFAMRSHTSPDAQLETFFSQVEQYFKYLYQRFIKQSGVVDPDLERLFINIIPNEKQHRDLLTAGANKVTVLDAEPKTDAGKMIKLRLGNAIHHNETIDGSLGNTSIIEHMKDLGVELYSLTSQRGKTGAFRQTKTINPELRSASEKIYATIREHFSESEGKMGSELDWGEIEAGLIDMDYNSVIELSRILENQWEAGGLRELVYKLDDTLRSQYFRHEQELILSPMAKDSFPDSLANYREGYKIKLAWQPKKPEIRNPDLVMWANKAKAKVAKTPTEQRKSDNYALKNLSIDELTAMATGEGEQAKKAAMALLKKWRATPAKVPKGFKPRNAIKTGNRDTLEVMLRDAFMAADDSNSAGIIKEIRTEMARRGLPSSSNVSHMVNSLVGKEDRMFNGPLGTDEGGIPEGASAVGKEFLGMFTHRNDNVEKSLRQIMYRFLNMLDMDTNSEFLGTKFLDSMTIRADLESHFGRIGDSNTPYANDMVNEIDLTSKEMRKYVNANRRLIVSLSGDNPEMVRDGIRGMARLALRTHVIPPSSKTAILDIYRVQSEAIKARVRRRVGGAASELQEMEHFFTESFIHYLSGKFPKEDNIFSGLNANESHTVIDIFDDVRDSVKYLTDGVVDKKKLVGIFDELAYSEPLGDNQIKIQLADARRDTMLRAILPAQKDMMVANYIRHLGENDPTRLELMDNFVEDYGRTPTGEIQIFWHSTINGKAFDRDKNPYLRPSRDGQHGRGIHVTTSADVGFEAYGKRPTFTALASMVEGLAAERGISKFSPRFVSAIAHAEDLHKAYVDSGFTADTIMKTQELITTIEARIARLVEENGDANKIDQQNNELIKQINIFDLMQEEFKRLDVEVEALHKSLNDDVGFEADPVMIPLVLRADRVAMFDATMHRQDSNLITEVLGRLKEIEGSLTEPSKIQQTILNGAEGGIAERIAERIINETQGEGSITGQRVYNILVGELQSSASSDKAGSLRMARAFIDDMLESLGYQAKVGSTQNRLNTIDKDGSLINSETKPYKEVVVFDGKRLKHLASSLFDKESSMIYSKVGPDTDASNPNFAVLTAAINTEGNINHRGFARVMNQLEEQGAPPTLTSALVAVAKRKTLSEGQANALKQYGPKLFFSKGSDRLRSSGMKWLGDFIQPQHGTGFHERQNSELGRRIVPILQRIKKLPDAKGIVGTWASKNNPMRTNQPASVTRIVKTLRRPAGHESEKRLSPEEFSIYQDLRATFSQEAISLKESGVIMGHIEDYFPQVWNKEAMLRDKDGVVSELARHLMRESIRERNADITPQQAVEKAQNIFNRLTDDDGVYMPPPTGGRRDSTGDHIDYQRMLRLDQYPDSLKSLEKYLESDLEGMMTKYFDLSTRRVAMANQFGANSHGYYDYLYTVEHGIRGAVELISKGKVFSREIIIPDANGSAKTTIEHDLFTPLTQDPARATEIATQALEIAKTQGAAASRDWLISLHPKSTLAWEKRADAIANALHEFEGKMGVVSEKEYKFTQGLFNVTQRKPVSPQDTFFKQANNTSKVLRSINAVSLLGWTTLTSLGDVALPLVRSGNFRAWANGLRKYAADPQYREDIQKVGVAIENLTHERLTGLVGADSTKATNAFFNFTMLTPWTNMNREMAGAVFHQAIISEQRTALTAKKGTAKYRTSMRFLNRYGLAEFGKQGSKDLNDPRVLDNDAVREGMIRFANESIFTPNSNDVPVWAQTPWGSIVFQLKSFPIMMQRLVFGEGGVAREAFGSADGEWKANPYPLLYMLTIGAGFGMASMASKDVAQSRGGEDEQSMALRNRNLLKRLGYDKKIHGDEDDFAGWYLDGLVQMGGLGLLSNMLYDSVQQLDNGAYGQMRVASTVFGPSVGLFMSGYNVAAGGWDAAGDAMGGESTNSKERQGIRALAERIPVVGGVKSFREGAVDILAGESEVGQSKSDSGFGSGFGSGGFGGGF